ncbi:hypothetical protein ISN44_As09g033260 [Arabidopsis suecica]|uniref:KIB1-4 beta-propeller domain-containing protein n=1 Tax=Arabidopsis suecica TaxID=45249 RepID=A0A8T2ALR1_ARASU|nr:hypothetical protein ISN44_As09g033260 [Arabidopsis suecica]
MSSLLLSLSSRPSLRKLALRCHTLRVFSSSTTTNPYLMYSVTYCGEYPEAGAITKLRMFDPAKEDYFTVGDKPLSKELAKSRLVGSSHGWGVFISSRDSILISDYCNPSSSKSNPKMIPLPPRQHVDSCQTELVSGVAMSSSPEEKDFVAAVKFMGPLVGIYMPGQADEGHLRYLPTLQFGYLEQGKLMYSKRDQRFYMPCSGGHHLWSWSGIKSTDPQYHHLRFHNLPQFSISELQLLRSCYRTQQLVESPSGQRFLVKWYVQSLSRYVKSLMLRSVKFNFGGTKRFMVFREEEDMHMCYTEDIGDLCIFLGNNEPFCVKASSFPGLNPNSIYFLGEGYGEGYGVYDIATRTPRSFNPKSFSAFSDIADSPNGKVYVLPDWVPHWIPPSPL